MASRLKRTSWGILGALWWTSGVAFSSGPPPVQDQLDLQARSDVVQGSGARAFGMGGAFLARADDATAASWNPAGLSYLRRPEITGVISSSVLTSNQTFVDGTAGVDHRSGAAPEFFAATYPFEFGSLSAAAQVSYERVVSFRNHRTFTNLSNAFFDVESSGGFDVVALGTGVRVFHRLRLGLAVNRWIDGYAQNVDKTSPRSQSFQRTDFGISAWNANLGVIYSPWESVNVGLVGKSPFTANVDLKQFRADSATLNYSRGQATLDFPAAVGIGLSYRPRSALTVSIDYTRTYWSDGKIDHFFILPPPISSDHTKPTPAPPDTFPSLPYPTLNDPDQKDTQQLRGGIEYVVLGERIKFPIRGGVFNDSQYFRGATGSAPRYWGWTAGTGIIVGPILVDAAYVHESGDYTDLTGTRNQIASNRVYVSVIYRHEGR